MNGLSPKAASPKPSRSQTFSTGSSCDLQATAPDIVWGASLWRGFSQFRSRAKAFSLKGDALSLVPSLPFACAFSSRLYFF